MQRRTGKVRIFGFKRSEIERLAKAYRQRSDRGIERTKQETTRQKWNQEKKFDSGKGGQRSRAREKASGKEERDIHKYIYIYLCIYKYRERESLGKPDKSELSNERV